MVSLNIMSGITNESWGGDGGDYSFLIQNLEGQINSTFPPSNLSTPSSNRKRTRLSIDSFGSNLSPIRERTETDPGVYSMNMRSMVEFDELKIAYEQLQEQMNNIKTEHKLTEERMLRQISFLDEQHTRVKKESDSRL